MPTKHSENPFVTHEGLLRGRHGAAYAIQALVRHLFCASDWPCDLSKVLRGYGTDVAAIGLDMQVWYAQHGENDPVFLEAGRSLAIEATEAKKRHEERQANGCQRRSLYANGVCGAAVAVTCCGSLCRDCADETEAHSSRCERR